MLPLTVRRLASLQNILTSESDWQTLKLKRLLCAIGIHDRCPIIMGCARDVDKVLARYLDGVATAGGESAAKKARTE